MKTDKATISVKEKLVLLAAHLQCAIARDRKKKINIESDQVEQEDMSGATAQLNIIIAREQAPLSNALQCVLHYPSQLSLNSHTSAAGECLRLYLLTKRWRP